MVGSVRFIYYVQIFCLLYMPLVCVPSICILPNRRMFLLNKIYRGNIDIAAQLIGPRATFEAIRQVDNHSISPDTRSRGFATQHFILRGHIGSRSSCVSMNGNTRPYCQPATTFQRLVHEEPEMEQMTGVGLMSLTGLCAEYGDIRNKPYTIRTISDQKIHSEMFLSTSKVLSISENMFFQGQLPDK